MVVHAAGSGARLVASLPVRPAPLIDERRAAAAVRASHTSKPCAARAATRARFWGRRHASRRRAPPRARRRRWPWAASPSSSATWTTCSRSTRGLGQFAARTPCRGSLRSASDVVLRRARATYGPGRRGGRRRRQRTTGAGRRREIAHEIRPPPPPCSPVNDVFARGVDSLVCAPQASKECTDTCHPFHHGATIGSRMHVWKWGTGLVVRQKVPQRRLAAVLNDRLTSDSDGKAACFPLPMIIMTSRLSDD